MKSLLFPILFSITYLIHAQTPDTSTVRLEIDSLIELNNTLVKEKKYKEALSVIQQAEEKCLSAFNEETALYGTVLFRKGRTYESGRDLEKAEQSFTQSKNIREKILGKSHSDYATSAFYLGLIYFQQSNFKQAESEYLEALGIREKVLGKVHPDYANSLNNLGNLYIKTQDLEQAEQFHLEAKDIREKTIGKENRDYGESLNNLGELYKLMGNVANAQQFHLEALTIREKIGGKENLDYIQSLNNLGKLNDFYIGDYEKAEKYYLEVKTLQEKVIGEKNRSYGFTLSNIGALYYYMGKYEKAELYLLDAIRNREKFMGKENIVYGACLTDLANLYADMGQLEKAEQLYLEVQGINSRTVGMESLDYALGQLNLAILYYDMGNYEKAKTLYREGMNIEGKIQGKENNNYAQSLSNLAAMHRSTQDYETAETLFLEALAIREKVLGKEHPDMAANLFNLALLYQALEDFQQAEKLLLEAKAIRKKVLGEEHPDYATTLHKLADLRYQSADYDEAEALYWEAHKIRAKVLGKEHQHYTTGLNDLAKLYWRLGKYEKADSLLLLSIPLERSLLTKASRFASEQELGIYTKQFLSNLNSVYSLTQIHPDVNPEIKATCFDNALFYKGFLLYASNQVRSLAVSDTTTRKQYTLLKSYQRQLAAEYSKPVEWRSDLTELEEKCNTLEKELIRTVTGFGQAIQQVGWQDVQGKLQSGEAALEFVHYNYYTPELTDNTMYAALLLRPGDQQPQFIPLFEESSLDSLLALHQERRSDYVNDLYSLNDRGLTVDEKPVKTLYELIWQPLEKELAGTKTIYLSPAGLLHRINLNAIALSDDRTITDLYNLVQVQSTRSLVSEEGKTDLNNKAVLFGGIQYEADSTALVTANEYYLEEGLASRGTLNANADNNMLRGGKWDYLKWTQKEVESINTILEVSGFATTLYADFTASEEAFRALGQKGASPRILHVATHGFFFPDPDSKPAKNNEEPVFKTSDNPMIRSGLIMAGGNHVWQGNAPLGDLEDGILTAYEISQMDLSNTELVVLSACETGLGDIQGNEGVYGLQRAFKIAGAKYLIMSLWQVPDRQTKDFMVTFYQHCQPTGQAGLEDKMSIPEAFRKTQQEMKERFYDPYMWAGFVLVE